MALAAGSLMIAAACGGVAVKGVPPPIETAKKTAAPEPRDADVESVATFDEIARGADRLAPAMRELLRDEKTGEKSVSVEVVVADRDACVRVAFAGSAELRAVLEDASGVVLAETRSKAGALGERGPVCVRKGGAIHARFEGPGMVRVRFVAWTAP